MPYETIRYEVRDDGVATIALDQPDTRNALSNQLLTDLIAAFEAARDDERVRCVVLTSTHDKVFSAGGSLVSASPASLGTSPTAAGSCGGGGASGARTSGPLLPHPRSGNEAINSVASSS